jgi:hypothetical protein
MNSRLDFYGRRRLTFSSAFLAHAFCSHWCWLTDLLYQPKANCFSASSASRERISPSHQDMMRLPMFAVNHLINAALAAECTRKKIVSGTDAFHRTSSLKPAAVRGLTPSGADVPDLDDGPVVSVAPAGSSSAQTNRSMIGWNSRDHPKRLLR